MHVLTHLLLHFSILTQCMLLSRAIPYTRPYVNEATSSEFPATQIPRLQPHPKVYQQLNDLLTQRIRTEQDLLDMLSDRAAYGSPLDPNRNFEQDYKRLDQLYTDLNRAMLTVYAQFIRDTPPSSRQVPSSTLLFILPR
jgi:hypothetical protein